MQVASAAFVHRRGAVGLFRGAVRVSTALHLLAEAVAGASLTDFWGDDDQADNDSLWLPTDL